METGKVKVALLFTLAIVFVSGLSAPALAWDPWNTTPFHLVKTCSATTPTCTVTSSTFKGIPVGTVITYIGSDYAEIVAVINVPTGSATGICDIAHTPPLAGICTFGTGTGTLASFHLQVAVTTDCTAAEAASASDCSGSTVQGFWNGYYWLG